MRKDNFPLILDGQECVGRPFSADRTEIALYRGWNFQLAGEGGESHVLDCP